MQGSGRALMWSLARKRGAGSAGGGPAGAVSCTHTAAVPKQPWKQGLSLAWSWAQQERSWCCLPQLTRTPLEYRSTLGLVTGNHPVPCPMEPWVWGWGANHSPQCRCSPGGRGARRGSKAWACPRMSRWISAEPKGATFGPKAPEWVGPAPTSGGGAGTESGRGLLHSRATLAPQCYIRDRAEP